ncbi:hypothetical protein TKK_0009549 [Trichogramma kaykai]|uniref:Uncharacterized protein n=1 Tax=Trichogramma kaykai TaxID=54128 RepID=A0ABD2X009_9HYME
MFIAPPRVKPPPRKKTRPASFSFDSDCTISDSSTIIANSTPKHRSKKPKVLNEEDSLLSQSQTEVQLELALLNQSSDDIKISIETLSKFLNDTHGLKDISKIVASMNCDVSLLDASLFAAKNLVRDLKLKNRIHRLRNKLANLNSSRAEEALDERLNSSPPNSQPTTTQPLLQCHSNTR